MPDPYSNAVSDIWFQLLGTRQGRFVTYLCEFFMKSLRIKSKEPEIVSTSRWWHLFYRITHPRGEIEKRFFFEIYVVIVEWSSTTSVNLHYSAKSGKCPTFNAYNNGTAAGVH